MSVSFTDHGIERVEGTVMPVNSYVVDGPRGLVVVDGQLTVTDARAVRRRIDELGRPVAGMVLTHGHPDHYAGAAIILDGLDVPILATAGVADVVSRDDAEKDGIVGPMMGGVAHRAPVRGRDCRTWRAVAARGDRLHRSGARSR